MADMNAMEIFSSSFSIRTRLMLENCINMAIFPDTIHIEECFDVVEYIELCRYCKIQNKSRDTNILKPYRMTTD